MSKHCLYIPLISLILFSSCDTFLGKNSLDYRQEMRQFVQEISAYARAVNPDFLIIPQNGLELLVVGEDSSSDIDLAYVSAIDGVGQEDLFYGYAADNRATHATVTEEMLAYLTLARQNDLPVLVIDYCSTPEKIANSYQRNRDLGFISFAADQRELDTLPIYSSDFIAENDKAIRSLSQAQNFLYLINPARYTRKEEFIRAVTATNYDLLIIDLFFDDQAFTAQEIARLRSKANGGSRLVLCYLSIGEAEEYRYYWNSTWESSPPAWLLEENPNWAGNYRVQYWKEEWKTIITGNPQSYLAKILAAGFDGVYLDLVDAFWEFE